MAAVQPPDELLNAIAHNCDRVHPAARFYRGSRAAADTKAKLVLFFHGGGWSVGDVDTYDGFVQRLCAETGAHYLSVDFRRAP